MNIIDISSKSKISDSNSFIENIPLFKIKPMNYNLPSFEFTNVIFQSMASVENFKHFEIMSKFCNFHRRADREDFWARKVTVPETTEIQLVPRSVKVQKF